MKTQIDLAFALLIIGCFLTPAASTWYQKPSPVNDLQIAVDSRESDCNRFRSFTSLGDSYACGYGSWRRLQLCRGAESSSSISCTSEACGKDLASYNYQFAQKYGLLDNFQYLSCNGNDTLSVLDSQVNQQVFGDPDLVTINVGGDDSSFFSKIVTACVYSYDSKNCDDMIDFGNDTITSLPSRLDTLFTGIRQKAPKAKVVVMSYAQFWGDVDSSDCGFVFSNPSSLQKRRMNQLAVALNDKLHSAGGRAGFLYADLDTVFAGNRICEKHGEDVYKTWFQLWPKIGVDTDGKGYKELSVFHPTVEGQAAYLRVLEEVLSC